MLESEQHSRDALTLQAHLNQSYEQTVKWFADFIQSLASDSDSESDSDVLVVVRALQPPHRFPLLPVIRTRAIMIERLIYVKGLREVH